MKEKRAKAPKENPPLKESSFFRQRWHRLDNTANLFPVITSKRFTNVYRLWINLNEPVIPELLQQALWDVLPWFSAFKVRMRRGFFWRYFETNPATPLLAEENDYPCRYIDPGQNRQYLFDLTYFEGRINLEVFHVLSDGTGAMQFLQAICCRYLILAHPHAFSEEEAAQHWFAEHAQDTEDSYAANYTPTKKANFREGRAYNLRGEKTPFDSLSVIHAYLPVQPFLQLCRQKGVSMTQYLTACIGWAVFVRQMKKNPSKWPVNIFVPVNLRNFFPSTTTLNFFSNIYVSLLFTRETTFDDVLADVKKQFEEKVNREAMLEKISYTVGSGYNLFIRAVPLPIKSVALRAIFEASARSSTLGFSNVGKVKMPDPFRPFVTSAGSMLSCAPNEPFKCCTLSYENDFIITFTSLLRSTGLQEEILRHLTAEGLDVRVESNGVDYESL